MSGHETRDIFAWLNQVLADHTLPENAFRVAYVIAQHINRSSGKAWPGINTVASLSGLNRRSVSRLTASLAEAKHLTIEVNRGRHHTNIYRLEYMTPEACIDDREDSSVMFCAPENRTAASCLAEENMTVDDIKHDTGRHKTGQQRHPNHLRTIDEPMERGARQQSAPSGALVVLESAALVDGGIQLPAGADPFPYFWRECPKQTGEAYARAALSRAVKRASPEAIIAGMKRYAISRIGEEHRYTKAPDKWLDGDHWNDVLEPKRKGSGQARSGGGRGKPSYLEIAAQHVQDMEGLPHD